MKAIKVDRQTCFIWVVTLALVATTIVVFSYVSVAAFGGCAKDELAKDVINPVEKTIAALDSIVDLGIKFGTTLASLGAAILLGLKSGMDLTKATRTVFMTTTVIFIQSAAYGIWWRFGVSSLWLNECLNSITDEYLQRRYTAHVVMFALGLLGLGVLVIFAAFKPPKAKAEGVWSDV